MTKVERVDGIDSEVFQKNPAKVVQSGHIVDVYEYSHLNTDATIIKLNKQEFVVVSSGEIKEFKKDGKTRLDNLASLKKSQKKLRNLINANFEDVRKTHWCTLTYAENMQDRDRLRGDFNLFTKRFRTFCNRKGYPYPRMIAVPEPQQRGAWHIHLLMFWDMPICPFIPNEIFTSIWQQGFTSIKQVRKGNKSITNLGNYLTSYLTDMPLDECVGLDIDNMEIMEKKGKKFVKGARMQLYPVGCNLYYTSGQVHRSIESWQDKREVAFIVRNSHCNMQTTFKVSVFKDDIDLPQYTLYIRHKQYYKPDFLPEYYGFEKVDDLLVPFTIVENF